MLKDVPYNEFILEVNKNLTSDGVFLTTQGEKTNTMVIGWGGVTVFWGKPVFIVPVRKSRYTYNQLDESGEFTVSIPLGQDLKDALSFCGSKSGSDYDKFKECNITPAPAKVLDTPIISECELHYECRVIYKQDIIPENLQKEIHDKWYPDYHTLFFGEIVACYRKE